MVRWQAAGAAALILITTAGLSQLQQRQANSQSKPLVAVKPKPQSARAKPAPGRPTASHPVVKEWMDSLSLRDKVAQLVIATCFGEAPNSRSKAFREFQRLVRDVRVGGLIVANRIVAGQVQPAEPFAMAAFLNRMQRSARIPLLVGADLERGASMRVSNTTKFPHAMAFGAAGDPELTYYLGQVTAREARALGVHWVFAPVADVNNNPENPIINIRSFGENPQAVASHVSAFVRGAHSDVAARVLVTAKHFPGHGDTAVDSHLGLPGVTADRARLNEVELVPFRSAIAAGVDSIMTAHMSVPALGAADIPATVSRDVLTGVLRKELNFTGLIVTDAMDMQGLTNQFAPGEAAVRALEAGADVLLMPPKPEEAIRAVVAAVHSKRLSRKRIDESVARVLAAKVHAGLHNRRLVSLEQIEDRIDSPEAGERAQEVADRAMTLLRNERHMFPLSNASGACVAVLAEGRYSTQGRRFIEEIASRSKETRTLVLDPSTSPLELDRATETLSACQSAYVAAFASVAAYRGTAGLSPGFTALLERLIQGSAPVALISFGNPYLLRGFPSVSAYVATFSTSTPAEVAAARALFGDIPIRGRLPVTILGLAVPGEGIQLPSRTD